MRQSQAIQTPSATQDSQNATRNAYGDVRNETGRKLIKAGKPPARRMESVASRLQDAAIELEFLLGDLPAGDDQEEVHEALGRIMETQQIVAAAHARLRRSQAARAG